MSTRTPTLERPVVGLETTELKRGALKLLDTVVIAVSSTAPAYSVATALGLLAAAVALGAPAAIWVGFIPVMGVAVGFYYLNRLDPNCGASYTWVGKALHPALGFLNGWVAILASLLFMSFAAPQAGNATLQLINATGLTSIGGLDLNYTTATGASVIIGIAWLAFVTYMVMVGIRVAARFQYVLLALEYFIVLGFAILGFFHGGGVVVSVFFYWGWDTAANINEETSNATENPGRAGMLGMVALLFIFLVAATSIQMVLTPQEIQKNGTTALTFFANRLVGQPWASLAILAFLSSTIATVQTTLLPSARTAFSMGRDGVIGRIWARVHPSWQTPALGTLILASISGGVALLSLFLGGLQAIVGAGVNAIGILVSVYYGFAAIACTVFYRKALTRSVKGFIFAGVYPLLSGLALFVLAGYLIYQDWTSTNTIALDANNTRFQVIVPLGVVLAGIVALLYSAIVRRPPFYGMARETAEVEALSRRASRLETAKVE
jgi:amino acid transporter